MLVVQKEPIFAWQYTGIPSYEHVRSEDGRYIILKEGYRYHIRVSYVTEQSLKIELDDLEGRSYWAQIYKGEYLVFEDYLDCVYPTEEFHKKFIIVEE